MWMGDYRGNRPSTPFPQVKKVVEAGDDVKDRNEPNRLELDQHKINLRLKKLRLKNIRLNSHT